MTNKIRIKYHVEGIVQGVGFRPFVYVLCVRYNLKGYVLNNSLGVEIDLEGLRDNLVLFEKALHQELPPLARMDFFSKEELPLANYTILEIRQSDSKESKYSLVSPDMSLCQDCLDELNNPLDRRHHYFFINCTNCGPRYSIVKTVPYDRPNTSMKSFVMCKACQAEYDNPLDRRYHAQPISCATCGPTLSLKSMDGKVLATNEEAIKGLAGFINEGIVVAMKGMGGFHLICDAQNDNTISLLRERKKRPTKPFAVMFGDRVDVEKECVLSEHEKKGLSSLLRPIVLLKRKEHSKLSTLIAPNIDRLGAFLPYTPLHVMLFKYLKNPIIATSANNSGEPIITQSEVLEEKLGDICAYYLDYNREILNASDDSVLQFVGDKMLMMRSSRGIAPKSFRVKNEETKKILAVGAHQKNAIAIYLHNQIILSPYIGDLDNVGTFESFERTLQTFKDFYDFEPDVIVGDLHPNYASTQWAKKQNKPFLQVQHHYAHILSAMFEHKLQGQVLGIAWDGTGYGDDGTIWGGEFLLCDEKGYERVAYFEPFILLGGDASIKDIKRIALSIFFDLGKSGLEIGQFEEKEIKFLRQIYDKKINAPQCSSVGRLFDAVAVLCGILHVSYDGESGLMIEGLYDESLDEAYELVLEGNIIRYKHIFLEMLEDKEPRIIATKFINALANIAVLVAKKYNMTTVLAGGVFQNRTLLEKIIARCDQPPLYFPNEIPINDGGICIGQVHHILSK